MKYVIGSKFLMIFNHRHNTGQFWSLLKWLEEPSDPDVAVENLKQFDAGLRNWFYDSLGGRYLIDSEYRKNTYTGLQARTRELLRRRPIAQPLGDYLGQLETIRHLARELSENLQTGLEIVPE